MTDSCIMSLTGDPITVGHRDIAKRASKMFGKIYVLIPEKSSRRGSLLGYDERKTCIENDFKLDGIDNFQVVPIRDGCTLVDEADKLGCNVVVRGLRNEQDLIYETDMASVNRMLQPDVETVYLPCKPELSFVSSSMVRELVRLNSYEVAEKFTSASTMATMKRACTTVVALTGGIACGKSTARNVFEERGWKVLDADAVNKNCILGVGPVRSRIVDALSGYGNISLENFTKDLADIVFSNNEARCKLESIAFPIINSYVTAFISNWRICQSKKIAVEVPLLFEPCASQFSSFFDVSVCIWAKPDVMLKRLQLDRGLSYDDAMKRISAQMAPENKASMCDYAIENSDDVSLDAFKLYVNNVVDEIERKI